MTTLKGQQLLFYEVTGNDSLKEPDDKKALVVVVMQKPDNDQRKYPNNCCQSSNIDRTPKTKNEPNMQIKTLRSKSIE